MLILLSIALVSVIRVQSVDYCNLKCIDAMGTTNENTACDCKIDIQACGQSGRSLPPDQQMRSYMLQLHNEYREKFASGGSQFPRASNMGVLVYDTDLEYTAQCWTNKCVLGHDKCRRTERFPLAGQNLFWSSVRNCDSKDVVNEAIAMWYGEVKDATQACLSSYSGCSGHFTQLIWAASTHVGCGRSLGDNGCTLVCNYGPAGNMLGSPVYRPGAPSCATDAKYTHLCKTNETSDGTGGRGGGASGGSSEGSDGGQQSRGIYNRLSSRAVLAPYLLLYQQMYYFY